MMQFAIDMLEWPCIRPARPTDTEPPRSYYPLPLPSDKPPPAPPHPEEPRK